jgi:hypothetical protein
LARSRALIGIVLPALAQKIPELIGEDIRSSFWQFTIHDGKYNLWLPFESGERKGSSEYFLFSSINTPAQNILTNSHKLSENA